MKVLGIVFALLAGMVLLDNRASAIAVTTETYTFTGDCSVDCQGSVTGLLTLDNYVIGDFFSGANFVSFSYTSNITSFVISSGDPSLSASGFINALGLGSVYIGNADHYFAGSIDGSFCVDDSSFCNLVAINDDAGINGIWIVNNNSVPEPGSFALAAAGLGGLLLLARRRAARTYSALR